jgi:hypothetical protein
MKQGIADSGVFLLFLSEGVESRPFVHLEVRHALALEKPVLMVHEDDPRHGTSTLFVLFYVCCRLADYLPMQENSALRRGKMEHQTTSRACLSATSHCLSGVGDTSARQ